MIPRHAVLSACLGFYGIWLSRNPSVTGLVFAAFLVIVIVIQIRKKSVYILVFLPFFFIYSHYDNNKSFSKLSAEQMMFSGKINSIPKIDGNLLRFELVTYNETIVVYHKIKSAAEKDQLKNLRINLTCTIKGKLQEPRRNTHFYGMDYREYLRNDNIYWILKTAQFGLNQCNEVREPSVYEQINTWRSKSIKELESHFSKNTAGLMNALLFGYRDGIEAETLQYYQGLGLTHLLAVSGFNVGIVTYFLYLILVRLGVIKEIAYILIILFLPIYIVLTGAESSIVRAGIMGMIVILIMMFRRKVHPVTLLSFVCIGMLSCDPSFASDLGFQLSFLMTFVLITSKYVLENSSPIRLLIMTTFICSLFSVPIILYHFFEFSLLSIPFNVIYIPFVSMVLFPISFFILILSLSNPESILFVKEFIEYLFNFSVLVMEKAQSLKMSVILGRPAHWIFALYFVAIFYFLYRWEVTKRIQLLMTLPFLMVCCIHWGLPYVNPKATISFINVGQGDSILIELPYRKAVYLIDTGGSVSFDQEDWEKREEEYDVTKQVVYPFLKAKGIQRLDGLIITHGDLDHAGGGEFLLENFKVNHVFLPHKQIGNNMEALIQTAAARNKIKVVKLAKGMQWESAHSLFLVLHPGSKESTSNNSSIVLWIKVYDRTFLLTGDIEVEAEKAIIKSFPRIKSDVLKVGHHGSMTSSTESFLDSVSPRYGIISAGENNIYGHPALEVLKRFKERGIIIYRTDQHGDISFVVDKERLKVKTAQ
ncbi:DNA internalization-related competence protein ComEC/Rec2 [Fictibacillus nanhaiensis]|uniref:DNA internalization-related competence protein ComEC/Rec2 n=1 Tax=Fictibacillus nanhaiensis TaxID=742169 RepID=UPI002E248C6C|nr:DNA internalization-related competence protein ComEC/Rec2 [Fictibacillus nanhaiensis]MED1863181.1 DNA internalization-related competence protein ComEC/Rec2 [Fictibacillus nanhaiensis]